MGFFSGLFSKTPIEKHDDEMRNLVDATYHKCRFCARCTKDDGKFYCNNEGYYSEIEKEKLLNEYEYPECGGRYFVPYMEGCNRVTRGITNQEGLDQIYEEAKGRKAYKGQWDSYLY